MEILSAVAVCIVKCFTDDGGSSSKDELCESVFAKVSLYSRSEVFLTSVNSAS